MTSDNGNKNTNNYPSIDSTSITGTLIPTKKKSDKYNAEVSRAFFKRVLSEQFNELKKQYDQISDGDILIVTYNSNTKNSVYRSLTPENEKPVFWIAGRNPMCHLLFSEDTSVSLRHLVLVMKKINNAKVIFGVKDLNSVLKFSLPGISKLDGAVTLDDMIFSVGSYYVTLLYKIPGRDISFEYLWDKIINKKTYTDEDYSFPLRQIMETEQNPLVMGTETPASEDNKVFGKIKLHNLHNYGYEEFSFTKIMFARGILIGRYERCHIDVSSNLFTDNVSRVHLMILLMHDGVYVVDLVSTNGTLYERKLIKSLKLNDTTKLILADDVELTIEILDNK